MTESKTLHVFLVDDDQDDRSLFNAALIKTGMPVTFGSATCCDEALQLLGEMGEDVPDLIFMDLNMPDIDGFECIRRIRKVQEWDNIPIIVYSTSGSPLHVETAGNTGATAYFKKPADFTQLHQKLSYILSLNLTGKQEFIGNI